MKVLAYWFLFSVFLNCSFCAEKPSTVTWEGKEIQDITDVHVGPAGKIIVIHSGGGFSTTEDKLPAEFLRAWGITADKLSTAHEARVKAAAEDFERAVRQGQFREVDGIAYDLRRNQPEWVQIIKARVIQVIPKGAILDSTPDQPGATAIFVRNLASTISDGDTLTFFAKPTGTFSFMNKLGDRRTVRAYDVGRPCKRDEIPDAIIKENKLWAKVVGGKEERDVLAQLPEGDQVSANGTGFFISEDGYLLTNFHVIENNKKLKVKTRTGAYDAKVVKADRSRDLALLKVEGQFSALPIGDESPAPLGETVFTIGFPNVEVQGLEPKYTDGKISSLSGLHDDPSQYQISVPIQPGNSGGPLVSRAGKVLGIVDAKLNDLGMLVKSGNIPQNVNYAIKAKVIREFLGTVPDLHLTPAKADSEQTGAVQATTDAIGIVLVY